jgi:hypothetical protein
MRHSGTAALGHYPQLSVQEALANERTRPFQSRMTERHLFRTLRASSMREIKVG